MREGSSEPGRGECFFVVEKTFRTRPKSSPRRQDPWDFSSLQGKISIISIHLRLSNTKGSAMSIELSSPSLKIDALARQNRHEDLAKLLATQKCVQEDFNFGFQAACESGSVESARMLLPLAHIISVSRGMRKAVWADSLPCLSMAIERLSREASLDYFDIALALADLKLDTISGKTLAGELDKISIPACWGWALRRKIKSQKWAEAHRLIEAGAPLDIAGSWHDAAGLSALDAWREAESARELLARHRQAAKDEAADQSGGHIGLPSMLFESTAVATADELDRDLLARTIEQVLIGQHSRSPEARAPSARKRL